LRRTSAGARSCAGGRAAEADLARVLVVGCGCRGQALARELLRAGHAVRGTTRRTERLAEIEAAGAEAVVADPDRLGTLVTNLHGVSLVCWLMGTAAGETSAGVHGPRLRTLLERLVDTPVRGVVYEAAGSVAPELLASGAAAVREASSTWNMPAELVVADPSDRAAWLAATTAAVERLLHT
jgi:nucleoside-diphosphate-sugar epimerase